MVDYNYIYGFLNNYAIYMYQVPRGSEEWKNTTINFAKELYQVLYNEEKYMLGQITTSTVNTYELKWGKQNDYDNR